MSINIWIINHYAANMLFDRGGRHYNFAKYLKRAGYAPVVFACNAKHGKAETFFPDTALWQEHMAEEIDVPFVFVRGRTYLGNGKQRILNMIDFYRNIKKTAKEYAAIHGKPDIIYASSVHPLTLVAGIQLARKFGVKCICEVRDLWPESIVEYSAKLKKSNPLIQLLYQGEKWIYKKADRLIFTMGGGYDYILKQGWGGSIPKSKVYDINNGVDLQQFQYNRDHYRLDDADLNNPEIFTVVYAGAIRPANNLNLILDVAKRISNPNIRFLIWGDGEELPALKHRLTEEGITNVVFKGKVAKKSVPSIVSRSSLNLMHLPYHPIFSYGISPNKLFEYLAAGKPVLCDFPCGYNPVVQYGAGMMVNDASPDQIAAAVEQMSYLTPEQYQTYCEAAVNAAQAYDFQTLTAKLIKIIEGMG